MIRNDNIGMCVAVVLSLGIHIIFVPLVISDSPSMMHSPPAKSTHLKTPNPENKKVSLGIEKSDESTLTWIGYEEYEVHRAQLAEVEQAAMTEVIDVSTPMPPTEIFKEISKPLSQLAEQFFEALQGMQISLPSREVTNSEPQSSKSYELMTAPEIPVLKPTPTPNPSDRYSEATSLINISKEQWKSGKPLAAEGIVLRPRKPSFTANQLVTNAPSGLVATLHINRIGKPIRVEILVSTGSFSIDRSLESSLYRWRASGERIDSLVEDETVRITIHIMFH